MPIARIRVTAVSDEGDNVIVWGRPEDTSDGSEAIGFVFQTKGAQVDFELAERASRLERGFAGPKGSFSSGLIELFVLPVP